LEIFIFAAGCFLDRVYNSLRQHLSPAQHRRMPREEEMCIRLR